MEFRKTRHGENVVLARGCRFESCQRHHAQVIQRLECCFYTANVDGSSPSLGTLMNFFDFEDGQLIVACGTHERYPAVFTEFRPGHEGFETRLAGNLLFEIRRDEPLVVIESKVCMHESKDYIIKVLSAQGIGFAWAGYFMPL